MRISDKTSLDLQPLARICRPYPPCALRRHYPSTRMPVIDAHFHLQSSIAPNDSTLDAIDRYLAIMDASHITASINLSGHPSLIANIDTYHQQAQGRILHCPGTYFVGETRQFWWKVKDLKGFKHPGIAGLKQWFKYRQALKQPSIQRSFKHQASLGIPSVGMHIADPPFKGFWQPNFWGCIADAEQLINDYPDITFIMAHGFWLMNTDEGLDVLDTYFAAYPNLHVDLSAVFQWWDQPAITYDKLRDFIIRRQTRILFGTDGNPNYTNKKRVDACRAILETQSKHLTAFFGNPKNSTHITGLNLPNETLNYIYWGNALRLIPQLSLALDAPRT